MLVHICCSVDSHYFLQKLREELPDEKLIGYFYNPNIHPKTEYDLRLEDVKRSCTMLGIKFIEGAYELESWLGLTKNLSEEPEKGKRCTECFDIRLLNSADKGVMLGEKTFTTTLLTSPKKEMQILKNQGERIGAQKKITFLTFDFRKEGGTQKQFELAKKDKLYKQNYCGCLYALKKQRDFQEKTPLELYSPIGKRVLPNSIEERLKTYRKRVSLERKKKEYSIIKEKIQNYRLLHCLLSSNNKTIDSYILHYSTLSKKIQKVKIEIFNEIGYLPQEGGAIIPLQIFNTLSGKKYKNIKELLFNPLSIKKEQKVRKMLFDSEFDLSFIAVVETLYFESCTIQIDFSLFEDKRDILIKA